MDNDAEAAELIAIDSAIVTEILDKKILGTATCVYVEGSWGVYPDSDPSGWSCHASKRPVYADHCYCEQNGGEPLLWAEKFPALGNHESVCLEPVLPYSTQIDLAFAVLRTVNPCGFALTHIDDIWIAELYDATQIYSAQVQGELGDMEQAAKALCLAMLEYVRGGARSPRSI